MMERREQYFVTDFIDDHRLMRLSDGKLRTDDGQIFRIHRFMLAKKSKYFYALFCGMSRGKEDVLIPGVKGEVLSSILSYLYTGNIEMTEESMSELMVASDYLMLDDLLLQIKLFLRNIISIVNCLTFFLSALKINRDDILLEIYRFVQTHFESVVNRNDNEFGELPLEALKQLLSDRNLCVRNERTVYLSIIRWIEADSANRLHWMPDLLMHLMIVDIDEDLATEIVHHDTIAKNVFCKDIMNVKLSFSNASNLKIIQTYFQRHAKPVTSVYTHRQPHRLNCIFHDCFYNGTDGIQIYLTYDENIDLWRKILDINFSPKFLFCIKSCIFMLRTKENMNFYYDIVKRQLHIMSDFAIRRNKYSVVQLDECIYILGGISTLTGADVYDVDVYDSVFDSWHYTTPMMPITIFAATSLNNFIYVVGLFIGEEEDEMVAQVYDARSETWSLLPSGFITRQSFALVSYLEKIYVIGGIDEQRRHLKAVETYDPVTKQWTRECDLPHLYYFPRAIVFHDLLVVYDNRHDEDMYAVYDEKYLNPPNPPVFWNIRQRCWEHFEESSPIHDLHSYKFLTIENQESINIISKENRDPDTVFEKSPFN